MDQAAVGATIQVVLQTLLSASIDEIKLVFGFQKELSKLKKSLLMIQDFLHDAEVKQVNNKPVERWLEELEDVAFEADAVLDECNYELLRQKVKKLKPTSNKVLCFLPSCSKNLLFRRKMAHKIDVVNKNLESINKEATSFGLQKIPISSDHAISSVGFVLHPTDSVSIEPLMVGRERDESLIVDMLLSAPKDEKISILPVLGMGGLGKTTLARKVFNNVKIGAQFEERIWVCVSTNFDATTIFKMILEPLSRENVQIILTKEVVLAKIREHLASKRYLLVLDDVWNDNSNDWDDFMSSLSGISHVNGNCMVVTTRSRNVASLVGTLRMHQPQSLSKDDCWSIIKSKAFPREVVPTEFEEIGLCIAQRCGGLPLVAKVIGGLLCGKSKNQWQYILSDQLLKFGLDDEYVMKILKLSYDRLPSPTHKKCFAYCSVFPQDHKIRRQEVIELWMAEGFLQVGRGRDMETVGDEIFNFFLQNSLFQDAKKDVYGNITTCRMHDLVHDLACLISGSKTVIVEKGRISDGPKRPPRYIVVKSSGEESFAILKQQARFLRTIFVEGENAYKYMEFWQLHVLKIMDKSIKKLPYEIGELIQLRLLDITTTQVRDLPCSIGKLYNLQTLYSPLSLRSLPKATVDLMSLRHLPNCNGVELPPWMGKLTCLQTLPYFKVGDDQGCGIEELGKLNNLKGFLKIQNLEKVKEKEEAQNADLVGKANIAELVLEWNETRGGEVSDENVLDGLQPHPNLKSLVICGYKSRNFPSWVMKMAVHNEIEGRGGVLRNLIEIKLENCKECEEVPMFGHLPQLRVLCSKGLSNVRSIGQSFYGLENGGMIENVNCRELLTMFPALEKLELLEMGELSEWVEVEGATIVFPCLKYLEIKKCSKLKSFPSHFPTLEKLSIYDCSELESIPCVEGLTSLRELKIVRCHKLEEIRLDLNTLFSLEELYIGHCRKLKSIKILNPNGRRVGGGGGDSQQQPGEKGIIRSSNNNSLRDLSIWNCRGLIDLPIELFQSSSLRMLSLNRLSNLENVERVLIPTLSKMSALRHLCLMWIPKLMNFPIKEICNGLMFLSIGGFSAESISLDSFNQHLNSILPNLGSLKVLSLYGTEDWESLPDQIQHLTSLQHLYLSDFGRIEALPEWIRNLSSLRGLLIFSCKRLRHLPSKEAMLSLTKLYITNCPLLAERCRKPTSSAAAATTDASSSEWPKISHINVEII